jgi:alkanesulfonate monooxygenase SsuD/methylene tetrahydromethanopterin reductase-like flavin-dependent oxidoreductase (luciferase family)
LQRALDAISGSFDSVWVMDHLQFGEHDVLEGWTTLTYLAALYPALRVGPLVLAQSYRNPALLAKMAATLDFLSGGRLILGLGTGWKEDEYRAYGYDFPPAAARVEQLEEALAVLRALWREERATVAGRHYRVESAACEPKPSAPPPVLIGARGPRMLRLAARHADWWNFAWQPIAAYADLAGQLDGACRAVGRDPATLRKTWLGLCSCAPTEAAARRALEGSTIPANIVAGAVVGTPAQVVEQLQPLAAVGVDYFIVATPDLPHLTTLELLRDEVLPRLNGAAPRPRRPWWRR